MKEVNYFMKEIGATLTVEYSIKGISKTHLRVLVRVCEAIRRPRYSLNYWFNFEVK